jgi:hypothetical protein
MGRSLGKIAALLCGALAVFLALLWRAPPPAAAPEPTADPGDRHAIVIDAGSSGSRAFCYVLRASGAVASLGSASARPGIATLTSSGYVALGGTPALCI